MTSHADNPDALHPRPMLRRAAWQSLCGEWDFAFDDNDVGVREGWPERPEVFDRTIVVPYPPESRLSGIGDTSFHGVLWYRRKATTPRGGERLLLHFGAADYRAEVWVNGVHVARHEGGHTPFAAEITAAVGRSDAFDIVVRAEDPPAAAGIPRGKQDWRERPHAIWYNRTSGIWQPVWLETVPACHISGLHLTPDLATHTVTAEIALDGRLPPDARLRVAVTAKDRTLAAVTADAGGDRCVVRVSIAALEHGMERGDLLWSPDAPNLLDVGVELLSGDRTIDRVESYIGLRSVGLEGGRFVLNGRPVLIRSVLEQGYYPDSHLAAPADSLRREVELIKALGFNAVRIHQKVEDPRFLHWCDVLGVMVWGEMPSAYSYTPRMADRFVREWLSVLDRDRSHPCIVTWVPLDESWGVQEIAMRPDQRAFASSLYWLTKAIDPTRPVISNDGWEHTFSDILGIHDYEVDGDRLAARYGSRNDIDAMAHGHTPARRRLMADHGAPPGDAPVMITEFGGIGFVSGEGEEWFGYQTVGNAEEFAEKLRALFGALHDSPILAGYCYTQLTDTMQETNGLLDETREPKLPVEVFRDIITTPSAAIPGEFLDRERKRARR